MWVFVQLKKKRQGERGERNRIEDKKERPVGNGVREKESQSRRHAGRQEGGVTLYQLLHFFETGLLGNSSMKTHLQKDAEDRR